LHDQVLVEVTDDGIGIEEKFLSGYLNAFSVQIAAVQGKLAVQGWGLPL
jgi:hypothetical protein